MGWWFVRTYSGINNMDFCFRSQAEYLGQLFPMSRVVKAFNVLSAYALESGGIQGSKQVECGGIQGSKQVENGGKQGSKYLYSGGIQGRKQVESGGIQGQQIGRIRRHTWPTNR